MTNREDKAFRLIRMHSALMRGEEISKEEIIRDYGISEKTARRDIDDLRAYLWGESGASLEYSRSTGRYSLVRRGREWMKNEDILVISKILLESRAFPKAELDSLLGKLTAQADPNERKFICDLLRNEQFLYVEPRHGRKLTGTVWTLSRLVHDKIVTEFTYTRQDGTVKHRRVKPAAIMFSEFYFYLIAFIEGKDERYPAVFRVDRIRDIAGTGEKFFVPYEKKFSDGEFRKRVQFMYAGPLKRVTFDFKGDSLEAVLDRLPTAEVIAELPDGTATVRAEAYGKGIEMWLRSQGDFIKNLRIEDIEPAFQD